MATTLPLAGEEGLITELAQLYSEDPNSTGIEGSQARGLIALYGADVIRGWIPMARKMRNPAAFLISRLKSGEAPPVPRGPAAPLKIAIRTDEEIAVSATGTPYVIHHTYDQMMMERSVEDDWGLRPRPLRPTVDQEAVYRLAIEEAQFRLAGKDPYRIPVDEVPACCRAISRKEAR